MIRPLHIQKNSVLPTATSERLAKKSSNAKNMAFAATLFDVAYFSCSAPMLAPPPLRETVSFRVDHADRDFSSHDRVEPLKQKIGFILIERLHREADMEPRKASVAELATWLSDFGDKSRNHFEEGKVQKNAHHPRIHQRVRMFENISLSGSSSAGSTSMASPSTGRASLAPNRLIRAASPVFRDFGVEDSIEHYPGVSETADEELFADNLENCHIIAVTKLIETPLKPRRDQDSRLLWDTSDNFSDPWAATLWHPETSRRPLRTDGVRITCHADVDDNAAATGRYTNPGSHRPVHRGYLSHRATSSNEDRCISSHGSNFAIHPQIPLLEVKSSRRSDPGDTNLSSRHMFSATSNAKSPPSHVQSYERDNAFANHSASLFDVSMFPSSTYKTPHPSLKSFDRTSTSAEMATASTWDSAFYQKTPSGRSLNSNLGDVFAKELELEMASCSTGSPPVLLDSCSTERLRNDRPSTPYISSRTASAFTLPTAAPNASSGISAVVLDQFGGPVNSSKKSMVQLRQGQLAAKQAKDRVKNRSTKGLWQKDSHGVFKKQFIVVEDTFRSSDERKYS